MGNKGNYCHTTQKLSFRGITSIASNGVEFIFLECDRASVILLNQQVNTLKTIKLKRKYSSICFDYLRECYWAIANNNASIIYQLDLCFNEINQKFIKNIKKYDATGISYNYCDKKIWISFSNSIGYVNDKESTVIFIENRRKTMINTAILSLPNCTLVSYSENYMQLIEVNLNNSYRDLMECIPNGYSINDMCLIACTQNKVEDFYTYKICLLLSENCSKENHIMRCSLKVYKNKSIEFLEDINYNHNDNNCNNKHEDANNCNSHCKRCCCNANYQLIQSIALEEAGIAHILNAEGEKIQKAVASTCDIDELLCVNESVKETIIHITQLETQLYLKLEAIQKNNCCDSCYKMNCCYDNRCEYPYQIDDCCKSDFE